MIRFLFMAGFNFTFQMEKAKVRRLSFTIHQKRTLHNSERRLLDIQAGEKGKRLLNFPSIFVQLKVLNCNHLNRKRSLATRDDKELIVEKDGRRHLLLLKQIRVIDEENYELRIPHDYKVDELFPTPQDSLEHQVVAENCTYFGRNGGFYSLKYLLRKRFLNCQEVRKLQGV